MYSCTNNYIDNIPPIDTNESKLNTEQQLFIGELTKQIHETKLPKSSTINPENLNNFMDGFGMYFRDMLVAVNQSERQLPSQNQIEYSEKWENYLNDNPILYDFGDFIVTDWEFYAAMADIIRTINDENSQLTVEQLKTFENIVAQTALLTDIEKEGLLALTAFRKYTLATITLTGITVGDIVILPDQVSNCWEVAFEASAQECLSVLVDTENAVSMVMAWVFFPGTASVCLGNAAWVATAACW